MKQDPLAEIDRSNERGAMQTIAVLLLGLAVIFAAVIVVARV